MSQMMHANCQTLPWASAQKYAPLKRSEPILTGHLEGYASLFNTVDLARDIVAPGAFRTTLESSAHGRIKMLYQHDPKRLIGVWDELREDQRGLFVKGHLLAGLGHSREVLSMLHSGLLDGLSIGFRPRKIRRDPTTGIRHLIEIELFEISLVMFPVHQGARISSIKSTPLYGSLLGHPKFRHLTPAFRQSTPQRLKAALQRGAALLKSTKEPYNDQIPSS